MTGERDVVVERRDGVMLLTIDRPEDGNMLRRQTTLELAEALRELRDDPGLSVGILTGAGDRFFCLGGEHVASGRRDAAAALRRSRPISVTRRHWPRR